MNEINNQIDSSNSINSINPINTFNSLDPKIISKEIKTIKSSSTSASTNLTIQPNPDFHHHYEKQTPNKKYYILYSLSQIFMLFCFFINFLITKDGYEGNNIKYINLQPSVICEDYMSKLQNCVDNVDKIAQSFVDRIKNETSKNLENEENEKRKSNQTKKIKITKSFALKDIKTMNVSGLNISHVRINKRKICQNENEKLKLCYDKTYSFSKKCQFYLNDLYECKIKEGKNFHECMTLNFYNCARIFPILNITKIFNFIN